MPRRLKTYQTSLGFYDLAIAAPSMKAALEAWGAGSNLFHQGVAKETEDADVVAATMAKPGVVLRRPAGSNGRFAEHSDLPADLAVSEGGSRRERSRAKPKKRASSKIGDEDARKAAQAFEKEQRRRETERREDAERAKQREKRERAVAKAQAAMDKAQREHEAKASAIEAERAALDERAEVEERRWEKLRESLEEALRRAQE